MDTTICVAQFRPRKANYPANLAHLAEVMAQALSLQPRPDVLVFPETALTGYFLQGGVAEVARPAAEVFADLQHVHRTVAGPDAPPLDIIVGFIESGSPHAYAGRIFNAAMYATLGGARTPDRQPGIIHVHRKFFLPTYGVFDEKRYVNRGRRLGTFSARGMQAGMLICEDAWHTLTSTILALRGASIIYIPTASPARGFQEQEIANLARWVRLAQSIAEEHGIYVVTSSLVGFEGGKGFIGSSVIVSPLGEILAQGSAGEECLVQARINDHEISVARAYIPLLGDLDAQLPDLIRELEESNQVSRALNSNSDALLGDDSRPEFRENSL